MVRETRESGGRDCGGEGNVMGETLESGGREGTVVRETGLIEGNMVVDPRREPDAGAGGREEMNTPSSEFDAEAEDDIELGSETPPMNTK